MSDEVNHPPHYISGRVECIEAIRASMTADAFAGYLSGNCMKYLWRYKHKGGVQDLLKGEFYLKALIELEKEREQPQVRVWKRRSPFLGILPSG